MDGLPYSTRLDTHPIHVTLQLALDILTLGYAFVERQVGGGHLPALVVTGLLQNGINMRPQANRALDLRLCIVDVIVGEVLPLVSRC